MTRRIRFILIFVFAYFPVMHGQESSAGDSLGVNSVHVIRLQLQSIADEVVEKCSLSEKNHVSLLVEGGGLKTLAENAFIESLQKKKISSFLSDGKKTDEMLHIFLYESEIQINAVLEKKKERIISTSIEARMIIGSDHDVHGLGKFQRESRDTAFVFLTAETPVPDKEESTIQQLLSPLIVISGAILIIYLLFTVRS